MNDAPFFVNGSFGTNGIIYKKAISTKDEKRLSGIYFNRTKIVPNRNKREKHLGNERMKQHAGKQMYTYILLC